jgi:hypothetical protein
VSLIDAIMDSGRGEEVAELVKQRLHENEAYVMVRQHGGSWCRPCPAVPGAWLPVPLACTSPLPPSTRAPAPPPPHTHTGARYSDELHPLAKPTHKLEVCMTGLAVEAAAPFFRDPAKSAAQVCV